MGMHWFLSLLILKNFKCLNITVIYENKQDIVSWFDAWKFNRPVFFTGVLSDQLGYAIDDDDERIRNNNKHFLNELHRLVFKKSKKKIVRLVIIEKGKGRKHCHMLLDIPEHLSCNLFNDLIEQSWLKTKGGIGTNIKEVFNLNGIQQYLVKEIYPNKEMLGVDIQNSYQ